MIKIRRMGRTRSGQETLYHQVAHSIQRQIGQGTLQVGDKVPSVRLLSRHHHVSVSTVLQAYFWLEHRGLIEARPRSGFYVRVPYDSLVPEPKYLERKTAPRPVETGSVIQEINRTLDDPSLVPFGAACPGPELLATLVVAPVPVHRNWTYCHFGRRLRPPVSDRLFWRIGEIRAVPPAMPWLPKSQNQRHASAGESLATRLVPR